MKVKLMDVLSFKDKNKILYGVKIQVNNRRVVFVGTENGIYSTENKDEALLKIKEVEGALDGEIIKVILADKNMKGIII